MDVIEYYKELRTEFVQEMLPVQIVDVDAYCNIVIAKIRKYNDIWNSKENEIAYLKKDGFKEAMKRSMAEIYTDAPIMLAKLKYL